MIRVCIVSSSSGKVVSILNIADRKILLSLRLNMANLLQNTAGELSEIDRDPWKDSVQFNTRPVNPAPGEYPSPRKKCKFLRFYLLLKLHPRPFAAVKGI